MSYVTQGTVQVELKTETDIKIRINPTQEYTVKREKQDYIVFIQDDPKAHPEAQIYEKNTIFTTTITTKNSLFVQSLIDAAFQQIKIEIKAALKLSAKEKSQKPQTPAPSSISIEIESIKIPALL